MARLRRAIGWLFGLPVRAVLSVVHRLVVGRRAVLWLEIEDPPDALSWALLTARLKRAAEDGRVWEVVLAWRASPGGWSSCHDLRGAILALRAGGKKVTVFAEELGTAAMWVASAADQVVVVPTGEVQLQPLGAELTFFGEALARVGVMADVVSAGEYKSFGETFTRRHATPENRQAVDELLGDLAATVVAGIASGRGLQVDVVAQAMALAPLSAQAAVEVGLIDACLYEDELVSRLEGDAGRQLVNFGGWAWIDARRQGVVSWGSRGRIFVVHLEGAVVIDDESARPAIRSRLVVPVLDALAEDASVSAVVLAVDSQGGSALASDLIWRAVCQLRDKKPVVAAFGDVAASGGYYLAASAHHIVARSTSLTGSIGVVGGKLVLGGALRRFGVASQPVGAGAGMFSPMRPFTDEQRVRVRAMMKRVYDGFVDRVAKGRSRTVEEVEPFCRGRVWTGDQALERGLVDEIGDVDCAVERARQLANLEPGAGRRVDVAVLPGSAWARLVQSVIRRQFGLSAQAQLAVPGGALPWPWWLTHAGHAMAWWPFELRWSHRSGRAGGDGPGGIGSP